MHEKYGKEGFAAVSVSLDDLSEDPDKVEANVLKFLVSKKATFTNLILNEKAEVWQEKLKFDGPPSVFVFDREGKQIKHFKDYVDYAEVEKLVMEQLKK